MGLTNGEKYLKDGVSIGNFMFALNSSGIVKERNGSLVIYASELQYFLNQPAKPTLSEDEKVILRNIDKKYKYISRGVTELFVCTEPPYTNSINYEYTSIRSFNHLFQFIKSRRRI